MTSNHTLTQKDLKLTFGWSRYLISVICRNLQFTWQKGVKQYSLRDIETAINQKLENPRTRNTTRNILINTLERLEGRSNVIEVNFLGKLSRKEKIAFYLSQREKIKAEGEELLEEIDLLAKEVKAMGLA